MGDFNLSHRIDNHQKKLDKLCNNVKESVLKEITRSISNNQLDYVLVNSVLKEYCYSTSFYNFISDHKAIVLRMGLDDNKISKGTREKLYFDKESHLKAKKQDQEMADSKDVENSCSEEDDDSHVSDESYDDSNSSKNQLCSACLLYTSDAADE